MLFDLLSLLLHAYRECEERVSRTTSGLAKSKGLPPLPLMGLAMWPPIPLGGLIPLMMKMDPVGDHQHDCLKTPKLSCDGTLALHAKWCHHRKSGPSHRVFLRSFLEHSSLNRHSPPSFLSMTNLCLLVFVTNHLWRLSKPFLLSLCILST